MLPSGFIPIRSLSPFLSLLPGDEIFKMFPDFRTFLLGLNKTTLSFGINKQANITVALKLRHIAIVVSCILNISNRKKLSSLETNRI